MRPVWHRVSVWLAAAVAAASVGSAAGSMFWHAAGETGRPRPAAGAAAPAADVPDGTGPILNFAPFGSAAPAVETSAPAPVRTALGLVLLGITIGDPDANSRAILRSADGTVAGLAVGQQIAAGVTLQEIHEKEVLLQVNGHPETLSFPEPGAQAEAGGVAALNAIAAAGGGPPQLPVTPTDPDAVIASFRSQIDISPQAVLDQIGLETTAQGYRIAAAHDSGVDRAGLQTGDVVTTVNGQQVGNIETDRRLFDEVAASGRARLEILRDDKKIVMTFPLR